MVRHDLTANSALQGATEDYLKDLMHEFLRHMPLPTHTAAAEQSLSQGLTEDAEPLVLAHEKRQNLFIYVPEPSTTRRSTPFKN